MGRKKVNKVYKYFTTNRQKLNSKCLLCNKTLNTVHGSNLLKHLRVHKDQYEEVIELNKKINPYHRDHSNNDQFILKECTNLVSIHGRPLKMLDDRAFQKILSKIPDLNCNINSKNIKKCINDRAASSRMDLAKLLHNKMICIKVDIASLSRRSFMGVNAQFADKGKIIIKNLAMIELHQRHTAEHLKDQILAVLLRFRIGLENVYCFTTDNGSNMLKMSRLLSEENVSRALQVQPDNINTSTSRQENNNLSVSPQAHCSITNSIGEINEEISFCSTASSSLNEIEEDAHEVNISDLNEQYNVEDRYDTDDSFDFEYDADTELNDDACRDAFTDIVSTALTLHSRDYEARNIGVIRCAAHTLQLAILDACNDPTIQETITSARIIVKRLLTQSYINIIRANNKRLPVLDCVTRWNSTANMLERLIELKSICDENLANNLPESVWESLQNYVKSLTPAKNLSTFLQAEQITIGDFYINWLKCKIELKSICTHLSLLILNNMTVREQLLFENEPFINAVFVDPRINSMLSADQQTAAKNNLKQLHVHLMTVLQHEYDSNNKENEPESNVCQTSTINTQSAQIELDELLSSKYIETHNDLTTLLFSDVHSRRIQNQRSLNSEIEDFLKEPLLKSTANILGYWETKQKVFPLLYRLAQVVLASPASQVSVERLFSSLGFVVSRYRYNLKAELIEDILFIRNNALYNKQ